LEGIAASSDPALGEPMETPQQPTLVPAASTTVM